MRRMCPVVARLDDKCFFVSGQSDCLTEIKNKQPGEWDDPPSPNGCTHKKTQQQKIEKNNTFSSALNLDEFQRIKLSI